MTLKLLMMLIFNVVQRIPVLNFINNNNTHNNQIQAEKCIDNNKPDIMNLKLFLWLRPNF